MMSYTLLLLSDNCININILNALEYIAFHKWINFLKASYEFLDFNSLGTVFIIITCCTCVRKLTCTLDKMQVIVVSPCFNVIFRYKI